MNYMTIAVAALLSLVSARTEMDATANQAMWTDCGSTFKGCTLGNPNWRKGATTVNAGKWAAKTDTTKYPVFMSDRVHSWNTTASLGAIIGFGVFGLMYAYTIISIFIDIKKRGKEY